MRINHMLLAILAGVSAFGAQAKAAPEPWKPVDGEEIRFDVFRNGNRFGTHTVSFRVAPDGAVTAQTRVGLKAGIGPVVVYRYDLSATETWRDGKLLSVDGQVNDDGKKGQVRARRDGDRIEVEGTKYFGDVPGTVLPSSHWNVAQVRAKALLSTGNGELIPVKVVAEGRETVETGAGDVEADRFLLDGTVDATLWYDETGKWVKLAFSARGQDIEYVLAADG